MGFQSILDEWENTKKRRKGEPNRMQGLIDEFGPGESDIDAKNETAVDEKKSAAETRHRLLDAKPEAEIDLHGKAPDDAILFLDEFIKRCAKQGLRKVLVIHGKGRHSSSEPVLAGRVLRYIQKCSLAGEYGAAPEELGGKGALWVILR